MATLIAIPVLGVLAILQSSIVSRLPLLHGISDLIMLAIIAWTLQKKTQTAWQWCIIGGLIANITSAVPLGVPLVGYSIITGIALLLRRRVWQVPILAMFLVTLLGTLITQGITLFALRLAGSPIPVLESFNIIILPSMLLNMLLSIPVYALAGELARWLYPEELEV
jgi:rod shape-determining protein MreD